MANPASSHCGISKANLYGQFSWNIYIFVKISTNIFPNCKIYLSKLQNIFVQIAKYNCQNYQIYLSKLQIYLSKLQNIFVKIRKVARFIFQISKCKFPNFIATLMASIASSHSGIPPFVADPQGQFLRRAIFRGQILVPILRGEPELTQNWFFWSLAPPSTSLFCMTGKWNYEIEFWKCSSKPRAFGRGKPKLSFSECFCQNNSWNLLPLENLQYM